MFRVIVIAIIPFLYGTITHAQSVNTRRTQPDEPALVTCETAAECIRLSDENWAEFDYQEAKMYMEVAAYMGSSEAQYRVGQMFENDIYRSIRIQRWGQSRDSSLFTGDHFIAAYAWYKIAAINGHPDMDAKLSAIWDNIKGSYAIRMVTQLHHLKTVEEELKNINSGVACQIAFFYAEGLALPQDLTKASAYFKEAHDINGTCGAMETALRHKVGLDVEKNESSAREMYRELVAERMSSYFVNYYYARMLEDGLGGPVDLIGAYKSLAATDITFTPARYHMLSLKEKMPPAQLQEAELQIQRERPRR